MALLVSGSGCPASSTAKPDLGSRADGRRAVPDTRVADLGSGVAGDRGLRDGAVADRGRVVDAATSVDGARRPDGAVRRDAASVRDSAVLQDAASVADAAASPMVTTERAVYALGEAVVVRFSGFPGNATDWVTIVPVANADEDYDTDRWSYTDGQVTGSLTFDGLDTAGDYEARGYFDWSGVGGYTVRSRQRFTVAP